MSKEILKVMARVPPWRWNLWGPWPPGELPLIPEDQIKSLAQRLHQQRPWLSAEQNWFAAERALRQKPWRPWVIRFSGEKERSGWDWVDLFAKLSIPVLLLGLSTIFSNEQRESEVVTNFIKEMQPLILKEKLRVSPPNAEVRGVARGMTLTALSQLRSPERKSQIIRFLLDSGLNAKPGSLFSLSRADLRKADLQQADLRGVDLSNAKLVGSDLRRVDFRGANLENADLRRVNLSGSNLIFNGFFEKANLRRADLRNANLVETNFRGADLGGAVLRGADLNRISWDGETNWSGLSQLKGAINIPPKLIRELDPD